MRRTRNPVGLRRRRRGRGLRRLALGLCTFALSLVILGAAVFAYLFLRPAHQPLTVSLEEQVSNALSARVEHGLAFMVGGTDIDFQDGRPALVVRQLQVKDKAGRQIIKAPRAVLNVDPLRLATGAIVPTRLELHDLTVKLTVLTDGSLAFAAGTDETLPFRVADAFEPAAPGPASAKTAAAVPDGQPTPAGETAAPADREAAFATISKYLAQMIDQLSGADNNFGGFDRLGISGGTFVLDDRSRNSVTTFRNIDFDFDKIDDDATRIGLSADGAAGRWSASVRGVRHPDGRRSFSADVHNMTLAEFQNMSLLNGLGFDTDMPIDASIDLGLDPAGGLSVARGQVATGSGYLKLADPDHEPVMLDSISTSFALDPSGKHIDVQPSGIESDGTSYRFQGQITPTGALDQAWTVAMGGSGVFAAERPGEKPFDFKAIKLNGSVDPSKKLVRIGELSLAGPQVALTLKADLQDGPQGFSAKANLSAGRMPAPIMLRLWPSLISAQVRAWLLAHMQGGTIERGSATLALDEKDFDKIKAQHSVADDHLQLDYVVSDMTLGFMDGVPPLRGVEGVGSVTGDTSNFKVTRASMDLGQGKQLQLPDGGIVVPSTDPKPTPSVITAHIVGSVESLTDLLSRDALKSYVDMPENMVAHGQVDGTLSLGLKLGQKVKGDDLKIGANAHITALTVEKIIGKQALTNGDITMALDKTGLRARGEAQIFGAPSTIDIRKPAGDQPGQADLQLTLDEAARAKAGFSMGKAVTGPIAAKVTAQLGASTKQANVELDLSRASLNEPLPGLVKAAGRAGKLTFVASQNDKGVDIDNIACDIGTFSARGEADLDSSGNFQSAKLSQLRLSPSDEMKVDVDAAGDVLKLSIRGVNIDARPYLKSLTSGEGPDRNSKDIDLDLRSNVLTGQNSQVMTGVDLKLSRRDGQVKRLQMNGKLGRDPLTIASSQQGAVTSLNVHATDAGAALLFLDLYKRVSGGVLDAAVRMIDNRMDGAVTIHNFAMREDPSLKRLTEETLSQSKSAAIDQSIDASNFTFQKLYISFSKTGPRVDVKEGALFGPQLGATVQGNIDLAHDRLSLGGTFVPIYGVNNLFAQLPVVGVLLGGGAHEGLFGLNYRINGSTANPNLTVDPLSIMAPGFLRKIFGAISDATDDAAAPTPSTTSKKPGAGRDPVSR